MTTQNADEKSDQMSDEVAAGAHFDLLCNMVEQLEDDFRDLSVRRDHCANCDRPSSVCLCVHMPKDIRLKKSVKIWIFQHPKEEKRALRTTRILEKCLSEKKHFEILKSRRFSIEKFPQLKEVYESLNTFVLFPSQTAINLNEFKQLIKQSEQHSTINNNNNNNMNMTNMNISSSSSSSSVKFHVIVIDGTWSQASGIYYSNQHIQNLKTIKLETSLTSVYTVRTQPRETFLSTLETVSIVLSEIEEQEQLHHDLVRPLKALCDYQMKHGAQTHQSKEYLIFNGMYKKPISKKNFNKIVRESKFFQQYDVIDQIRVEDNYDDDDEVEEENVDKKESEMRKEIDKQQTRLDVLSRQDEHGDEANLKRLFVLTNKKVAHIYSNKNTN